MARRADPLFVSHTAEDLCLPFDRGNHNGTLPRDVRWSVGKKCNILALVMQHGVDCTSPEHGSEPFGDNDEQVRGRRRPSFEKIGNGN